MTTRQVAPFVMTGGGYRFFNTTCGWAPRGGAKFLEIAHVSKERQIRRGIECSLFGGFSGLTTRVTYVSSRRNSLSISRLVSRLETRRNPGPGCTYRNKPSGPNGVSSGYMGRAEHVDASFRNGLQERRGEVSRDSSYA